MTDFRDTKKMVGSSRSGKSRGKTARDRGSAGNRRRTGSYSHKLLLMSRITSKSVTRCLGGIYKKNKVLPWLGLSPSWKCALGVM